MCRLVCACVLSLATKPGYLAASRPNYHDGIPEILFSKKLILKQISAVNKNAKLPNTQQSIYMPCGEYFSEPTVCFNAVRPRGGEYGCFICLFRAYSLFQRSKTARWGIWLLYLSFQSLRFVSTQLDREVVYMFSLFVLFRANSLFQRSKTARWCIWFLYLSFQSPQFVSTQ